MLNDYLLDRCELPVNQEGRVTIPYPSIFLDEGLSVRNTIPAEVFEETMNEWYDDLSIIVTEMEHDKLRSWYEEAFLKNKPELVVHNSRQCFGSWEDLYTTNSRGFPQALSISRNSGGTLFFAAEEYSRAYVFLNQTMKNLQFSEKKARFLGYEFDQNTNSITLHAFSQHNVDYLPGALFLRNWAVNSINQALIALNKQKVCFDDYLLD